MITKITKSLSVLAFLLFSLLGFSFDATNVVAKDDPIFVIKKTAPGNKLFLSVPADGIPASVTMCTTLPYKLNVSNLQATAQAGVTLDAKFPTGIVPVAGGVTVNGTIPAGNLTSNVTPGCATACKLETFIL